MIVKFVDFRKYLETKFCPAYLISGEDRYLVYSSLDIIKKKLSLNIPDMNCVEIFGEDVDADKIVNACEVLPFGDEYRLVIVKDFQTKKIAESVKLFQNYLKNPSSTTILVFFCTSQNDFFKKLEKDVICVNCNKLDESMLKAWILNFLKKTDCIIDNIAMDVLIDYTQSSLTRISSELVKLSCFVGETKHISVEDVQNLVTKDVNAQIFDLCENIALGKTKKSIEMLHTLASREKSGYAILTPLLNYFRRMFFVKISDGTTLELASKLGVKEYAIIKIMPLLKYFTAKELKIIVEMLAKADLDIKSGKMKENVAVITVPLKIIDIRKNNGK